MVKMRPKTKPGKNRDDPEQSKLFIAKAREIGADGKQSAADELLGHLAKMPPQPKAKSNKRPVR
jgi:hypothetical protein